MSSGHRFCAPGTGPNWGGGGDKGKGRERRDGGVGSTNESDLVSNPKTHVLSLN